MPITVTAEEDGTTYDFPDDATPDQITEAMTSLRPPKRDIRSLAKKRLEALTGDDGQSPPTTSSGPREAEQTSPEVSSPRPSTRPRPVPKPEPEGPSVLDAVLTPELQAARKRFAAARLSASNAPNQPADDAEQRLRSGGLDVFASPKPPDEPYDPAQEKVHRVGDFLTAAGAAAREAIGGFGDISPDATPIQRARLRRPEGLNLAGGGVRKYEPPPKDEPYLPEGAGVRQYRPTADRAAERLAALQRGDDGTIRREGAQPLFAGKALGEAPATTRLNPEDTLRAKLEGTAPVQTLENDYTKAHDWMQGASDDFGHWLTEDTQHSALARLIDAGENSDSAMAQVVAAGTKGIAQAGASSAPALAEFALLHRATPGALKPLADAAMVSWFGGEGVGQALEALPHAASDIGSAIGGAPAPFDEMAQHLGQLGMGTFMAASPFGAKQHIADSLEAGAPARRPVEYGPREYQPEYGEQGPIEFRAPEDVMAKARGLISPLVDPRLGEFKPDLAPPPARGSGAYARDVPLPPGEVAPRPGQPTPEQLKAMLDSILGPSVEGTRQGPFPVPPDISQGRTLPPGPPLPEGATWQERQDAARRQPAPPEPPAPPPPPPSMPPRYAPPEIPPDATWQSAQAAERGRRANPLEDPAKLKEILSNLLGPEAPQELEARTGRTPPAAEKIQPEPQATLDAQMQALVEGRKPAVLFPRQGEHAVPETPEGFVRVDTPAGAVIFDPNKVDAAAVAKAADSGKGLGKILGMGVDERPEGGTIVTARTPEGTEVQSAQATPEQVPAAVEAARKVAGPEGKVTEGTTEQIVAERQAGLESEKGDIALRVAKAVYGPNAQPASVEFVRRVLGGDVPPKAAPKVVERIRAEAAKGIAPPAPASAIHPAIQGAVEAKRHAGSNIEAAGDARVVRLNGPDGASFVIHESPSEPGKWQLTRFEGDAPTGHVVFGSREDAIRSASGQRVNQQAPVGDRRYVVEPGKAEAPPRKVAPKVPWRLATDGMDVVPVVELKFSNGKWAQATGAPADAKWTGEKRTVGYAWKDRDGVTVGKRYATEAEARMALEGEKARLEAETRSAQAAEPLPEENLRTITRGDFRELTADPSFRPGDAKAMVERPDEPIRYTHAEVQSLQLAPTAAQRAVRGGAPVRGPVEKHVVLWGADGEIADRWPIGIGPEATKRAIRIVRELNDRPEGGGLLEQTERRTADVGPPAEPRRKTDFVDIGALKADHALKLAQEADAAEQRRATDAERKAAAERLVAEHAKARADQGGSGGGAPAAHEAEGGATEPAGLPAGFEPTETAPTEPRVRAAAPEVVPTEAAGAGKPARIWVTPKEPLDVEYKIVEGKTVRTSHDKRTGEPNPEFGEAQPRKRDKSHYLKQQADIAREMNPDFLMEDTKADSGAPVTAPPGPDGVRDVRHGNGRKNAIDIAYEDGTAEPYRQRLIADATKYGETPESVAAMESPVLIREQKTEHTAEKEAVLANASNKGAAARMGVAEQAAVDAQQMTPELLSQFAPSESGDIMASSNRPFLRGFFGDIADSGDMVDRAGNVSAAGVARVKAAILAKAYGETSVLERALEAADDNTRNVSAGLLSAAPRVAKVRAMAEAGELHPVDFTTPIKEAVDHLAHARDAGASIPDYLDQQDLFGDQISPEGKEILSFLDKNKRSPKKIAGFIDSIAQAVEAAGHPDQADLFGGANDAPTLASIIEAGRQRYEARFGEAPQGDLFAEPGARPNPRGPDGGDGPPAGPGEPGGGGPGVYGSPAGRPAGRSLVRSRGGLGGTPESEPVRPGGARSAAVRPDVERYDSPSDAPRPATMAGPGTKAETNPREIVKELETVSGTPIRYGHGYFAPRRAMGWFDPRNNAIRLRTAEDIVTAAHEVGHSIHKFVLQDRQGFPRPVATELDRLGRDLYGSRVPNGGYIREGMAEYVAKYLIGDDMTKDAPELHKWLRANMTPEKLKGLDAARDLYRKWDEAGAVGRVMGKIHTVEAGPVAQLKDGWEKLTHFFSRQMWTNKFAPLDDVVAEIKKQHGLSDLEPTKNPAVMAAALEKNAPGTARSFIFNAAVDTKGDVVGGSLADALKEIPHKELPELMAYSYARRAVDLWERDINPGITLADAKATVAQLESPQRRAALDGMTTWSNHLLDYVVKSGGLTATEAKLIRDANPVYVPLKRYFDEVERGGGGGARSGFVNQGKAVQKIRGSGRSVINPIDSFIRQADSMIRLGNKLRVGRSIVDLANEKPGLAWFAQKVEDPKESTTFSVRDLKRQLEKAGADLSSADLDATMSVFQNAGEYRGRQNIVSIVRNGQREFWELDPDVYRVVTHMDHEALPTYLSALAAPKRMVQLGATGVNAGFSLIANPIRDAFTWAVYSKGQHLTPAEAFKGLWSGLSKSPEAQRWKALGGELSTLMGQDRIAAGRAVEEALARTGKEKAWITLRHPIDALREHLGIFESGPRIAEFTRVLKDAEQKWGKGTENAYLEALLASKEATVNFTRAGVIGQALNQLVPFFNARIQGASKFYRTFGGPEGKSAALKATAQAVAWITVPTMALWYINKDEEWYRELKSWEKGAFWVWSTDHGKTKYRIPKPQELGYVFGSVPEAFADYAYRKNARGVSDAMWGTMDSLMPFGLSQGAAGVADVLPAAIKPLIEAGLNYDTFKNRPIVDPFLEKRKLPKDQYQKYTTEIAKQIGKWLNISPSKIDHTVSGYTGGLGLDVARGIELATGLRKGKDIEGLEDVPVLGRLGVRPSPGVSVDHMHEVDASLRQKVGSRVATEAEKVTLKRIASAKTAIDHARIAAEGAKGDDLHLLNSWSTHMAQWALGKREEMPYDEAEALEQKFPSDEWDKAFRAMNRKIPTYEAEAPPE